MPGKAWRETGRRLAELPPERTRQRAPATVRLEHCEGCGQTFPGTAIRMVRVGRGSLPDAFQALCDGCRARLESGGAA